MFVAPSTGTTTSLAGQLSLHRCSSLCIRQFRQRKMDSLPNSTSSSFSQTGSVLRLDCMNILCSFGPKIRQAASRSRQPGLHPSPGTGSNPNGVHGVASASNKDDFQQRSNRHNGSVFSSPSQTQKDCLRASWGTGVAFPCTVGRGMEPARRLASLHAGAKDSSQHGTADAISDEEQSRGGIGGGDVAGSFSELLGVRQGPDSNLEDAEISSELEKEGFVLGLGHGEAWDGGNVGSPVVRRYLSDNEERWLMWYSGSAIEQQGSEAVSNAWRNESIGLAISSNGIHWERGDSLVENDEQGSKGVGKVLDCSSNWWAFDTESMRPSDVLVMSSLKVRAAAGVYWMYYTGSSSEEVEIPQRDHPLPNLPDFKYRDGKIFTLRSRPGLVMSHDGRNWARIEGDHHSGALFDVGSENEWDSSFITAGNVVYFSTEDLRMYYHSFDVTEACFAVGFARSRDGMKWVKFGKVLGAGVPGSFDELGLKCPQVIPHPDGKGYLMIYEGVAADGSTSFGLAFSRDGLSQWERCSKRPVFTPAAGRNAWDSKEIHCPCLVHMDDNQWCLYYQGVDNCGNSGIGMAICDDGKLQSFRRCHGLHI